MYTHAGFVSQAQVESTIAEAVSKLGNEVIRVRYSIHEDTTGDPAIYFRILITDAASQWETLGKVSQSIMDTLTDVINPYEAWGLIPYFSFRSESEHAMRYDPEWA